ncbi:MAG: endonuclease NucS [Halobacteria archaeon]
MSSELDSDRFRSVTYPDLDEAVDLVETGVQNYCTVSIHGKCRVTYSGRADSRLSPGDRLVVVKRDGTVLVHQSEGRKPVNWQPSGSTVSVGVEAGEMVLDSECYNPREILEVVFEELYQATRINMKDNRSLSLQKQEEDMVVYIQSKPEVIEEGFRPLKTEYPSKHGRIDIYGKDSDGNVVVVEVKRKQAGPSEVDQLQRYMNDLDGRGYEGHRGILVAPEMSDKGRQNLDDLGLEFRELEPVAAPEPQTSSLDDFT